MRIDIVLFLTPDYEMFVYAFAIGSTRSGRDRLKRALARFNAETGQTLTLKELLETHNVQQETREVVSA